MNDDVKNPALIPLFNQLRDILKPYEQYFMTHRDEPGYYDLYSAKEMVINGRKKKEVYFAGLIIQKHYVGFYYMPIYNTPELSNFFGPELLSNLKGKSCFYITRPDQIVFSQIKDALSLGLQLYRERDWLSD